MKIFSLRFLSALLFLLTGTLAYANARAQMDAVFEEETVDTAGLVVKEQVLPPTMSSATPIKTPITTKQSLSVSDTQPAQAAYTGMAPGICLVVDEVVRQFCAANPDDISCQFQ